MSVATSPDIEEQELIRISDARAQELGDFWNTLWLQERIAALEFALDDVGWKLLSSEQEWEFSRDHLKQVVVRSRAFTLKNVIIHNGLAVQANYVMGRGVSFSAEAAPVNDVLQKFVNDKENRKELTSPTAQREKEIELAASGNLFLVLFTSRKTGRVRVRSIVIDEIADIVTDPDDRRKPWYYKRTWQQTALNPQTGNQDTKQVTAFYPDWKYNPTVKPKSFGQFEVLWDNPIAHLPINRLGHMRFGVPDTYPSLDWALEATRFHEDGATIRRAQARYAAAINTKGGRDMVSAVKAKLNTTMGLDSDETNPPAVTGSTAINSDAAQYTLLKMAGNAPDPKEATGIIHMAAAGLGIPETMLIGKVDVGNRATAESLDRPTELKMLARQEQWGEFFKELADYVIDAAVRSIAKTLKGRVTKDDDGEEQIELAPEEGVDPATKGPDWDPTAPMSRQVNIIFPQILERSMKEMIDGLVAAFTLAGNPLAGVVTPKQASRLLLEAIGVDDVDEMLDEIYPPGQPEDITLGVPQPGAPPIPGATPVPGQPPKPPPTTPQAIAASNEAALQEALRDLRTWLGASQDRLPFELEEYHPSQPRGAHGRWIDTGGHEKDSSGVWHKKEEPKPTATSKKEPKAKTDVKQYDPNYEGSYHDDAATAAEGTYKEMNAWLKENGINMRISKSQEAMGATVLPAIGAAMDKGIDASQFAYTMSDGKVSLSGHDMSNSAAYAHPDAGLINYTTSETAMKYWNDSESAQAKAYASHWQSSPDPSHVTYHEMGHVLHYKSVSGEQYEKSNTLSASDKKTAFTLSRYAATNGHEFVAEGFARQVAGWGLTNDQANLYAKLGGPEVPEQ